MRLLLKICLLGVALYVLLWGGVAIYFNFADRHKPLLEANLESFFKRPVSIRDVTTGWKGFSPVIRVDGLRVEGDQADVPALAFDSLSAELEPFSILKFRPQIADLAVQKPVVEIVSLPDNKLQLAGILLGQRQARFSPREVLSWLIDHHGASWLDGEIVWRKLNGSVRRYQNVSFVYERLLEERSLSAAAVTTEGAVAVKAQASGNPLRDEDWDASLEVLGDEGQRLLAADDLSLVVEKGRGRLQLRALGVDKVRDFLSLSGLGEVAAWVMDAELSGRLANVQFDFVGPFLAFEDWSLKASARDVSFLPVGPYPGLDGLNGNVEAGPDGGRFTFTSAGSQFVWSEFYAQGLSIDRARGDFYWQLGSNGVIQIELKDGALADDVVTIEAVDAMAQLSNQGKPVGMLADLFTAESVRDFKFANGQVVNVSERDGLFLRADAKFAINAIENTERYLPADPRIEKLREWWANAFIGGSISDGKIRYEGLVSRSALREGKAQVSGRAKFQNAELDYGYQREWPRLRDGHGRATLSNEGLTLISSAALIGDDEIDQAEVSIKPFFETGRVLSIDGSMRTQLPVVADFLFAGPLLSRDQLAKQANQPFPVQATAGSVSAEVAIKIPLKNVRDAQVEGFAKVRDGALLLPSGVPVEKIRADVRFTEQSADAEQMTADFLGGRVTAELLTTEAAQPPKLQLQANGRGDIKQLEPWIGPHVLSWLNGNTDWQGELNIDNAKVTIDVESALEGVAVSAPEPLLKAEDEARKLVFAMRTGGSNIQPELALDYGKHLRVHLRGDAARKNNLLDRSRILIADNVQATPRVLPHGVNIQVNQRDFDLDAWLEAVIELALLETEILNPAPDARKAKAPSDTSFLDAMRSVKIAAQNTQMMGRNFGGVNINAASTDGKAWLGTIIGDNIDGTLRATPRAQAPEYALNLAHLNLVEAPNTKTEPEPIARDLRPEDYPAVSLSVSDFVLDKKSLGRLQIAGAPSGKVWRLSEFALDNTDISTSGEGQWSNTDSRGSLTEFSLTTTIDEAGGVLDGLDFVDLIRKGDGHFKGNLSWIGAPHEFDFARLNGDFDLQINNGELMRVESGAGRLIGLLNFNSIMRRLTLDFRDVFSSGLTFDKMQYTGIFAEGKAIMREAFMLSPSVFVQIGGNIDLGEESIDMEIHASPELGGNLALLSAIANPTAGAVVFLTQRIFKDQMRSNSFRSYRALGSWDEFELEEIDDEGNPVANPASAKAADNDNEGLSSAGSTE